MVDEYWRKRSGLVYYHVVREIARGICPPRANVLDVGSHACPHLDWFPEARSKTSVDLRLPFEAADVESIKSDFMKWEPECKYELVLCLQVLEHVPDAQAFAQKLLEVSKRLVVSVPLEWEAGKTQGHVHDPVDREKLEHWFGRTANYEYECREVRASESRLIQVYEYFPESWSDLRDRRLILNQKRKRRKLQAR